MRCLRPLSRRSCAARQPAGNGVSDRRLFLDAAHVVPPGITRSPRRRIFAQSMREQISSIRSWQPGTATRCLLNQSVLAVLEKI